MSGKFTQYILDCFLHISAYFQCREDQCHLFAKIFLCCISESKKFIAKRKKELEAKQKKDKSKTKAQDEDGSVTDLTDTEMNEEDGGKEKEEEKQQEEEKEKREQVSKKKKKKGLEEKDMVNNLAI